MCVLLRFQADSGNIFGDSSVSFGVTRVSAHFFRESFHGLRLNVQDGRLNVRGLLLKDEDHGCCNIHWSVGIFPLVFVSGESQKIL